MIKTRTNSSNISERLTTHLLDICSLVSLWAIGILSFPCSLFLRRHSRFVTTCQEFTVSIHDHEQLVTCLITVARVQEMLQGDWTLRGADDVDLFLLGASAWLDKRFKKVFLHFAAHMVAWFWHFSNDFRPCSDYFPKVYRRSCGRFEYFTKISENDLRLPRMIRQHSDYTLTNFNSANVTCEDITLGLVIQRLKTYPPNKSLSNRERSWFCQNLSAG